MKQNLSVSNFTLTNF